jgi:hypothetical protein
MTITGFFAAALLPLFYNEVPSLIVFRWYWTHGKSPMPPDVAQRAAREGLIAPFVAIVMLAFSTWWLISRNGMALTAVGMNSAGWRTALGVGVLAGFAWLALYVFVLIGFRPGKDRLAQHLLLQHAVFYWIPLGVSAAAVEEVWRAFCLVALASQGPIISVAVTSVASGWGHPHPRARLLSTTIFAIYSAELFLRTRSLWTTISAHAIVNIGTLSLIHFAFRRARPL